MIKTGIIGASGYTGEELVRLLLRHPEARLSAVASRSLAGRSVAEALPQLRNLPGARELAFVDASSPEELARLEIDAWFLALPHGVAAGFVEALLPTRRALIDLSADFRLNSPSLYEEFYGRAHPRPDLLASTPYVIPECTDTAGWSQAQLLACPGCYPTSVQIPLVPLLRGGVLSGEDIVINSASGISGAGKKTAENYLFCERDESMTPYGLVRHRHLSEIEEQLSLAAGSSVVVQFNPHLIPIRRGILTTITCPDNGAGADEVRSAWTRAYGGRPFVDILDDGLLPDTARVANTNRIEIAVAHDPRTRRFVLTSALDNLQKGAAGQAIQIFNHRFGFDEASGLTP